MLMVLSFLLPVVGAVFVFREKDNARRRRFTVLTVMASAVLAGLTALPGLGHFIHTYVTDGSPIPSFQGEPERVSIPDDIDAFTADIWDNLDADNRISLYVSYTDLVSGTQTTRLINKNQ
jgi:hypothetical protein